MSNILVSGLVNLETTCSVRGFPIAYTPIDYNFFGVQTAVSGVGFNVAKALTTLGNHTDIATLLANDLTGDLAVQELNAVGIGYSCISYALKATPASTVLYDESGRRKIYCDLKDIQETAYDFDGLDLSPYRAVIACNINFSRPLLHKAKAAGIPIATDVHTLSDLHDGYNREFMANADLLFLSDEAIPCAPEDFLHAIAREYGNQIIVLGCGSKGAVMYVRDEDKIYRQSAANIGTPVNTVGAGDALLSAFVSLWCEGLSPAECLRRAQLFAAAKIRHSGAANGFITRSELEDLATHGQ